MSRPPGWTRWAGAWCATSSTSLRGQGTCVFLNSHLLSEIEVTCDRVAFIKHGEVVRVTELKSLECLDVQASVTIRAGGLTPEHAGGPGPVGAGHPRWTATVLTLAVAGEAALPEITRYLVAQGADVYAITPQRLSLEDLFIQTVGTDGGL